ncbi:MAG: S41 family peptidase [Candidatus Zixiibacteriota bacterium]
MWQRLVATLFVVLMLTAGASAAEEGRLLRFPDISGNQIVFCYAGDLYTVPTSGGLAHKLTNSEHLELFPRFSPDGRQLAFTGQYDGEWAVFVMPSDGGEPKRLTYHPGIQNISERMGPEHIVFDWTPDGSRILYRSREERPDAWEGRLYLVSPSGGYRQPLPLPRGGFASFNSDGTKIAYCPIFRDFRTWKRYKGGAAQDVWIYDFVTRKSERITDWEGTDNIPMWDHASGKIYFNSDRTGTLNLYAYDPATGQTEAVTNYTEYDVRWPAMGPGAIVYENGGYLYVIDLPNGQPRKVDIQLGTDKIQARPRVVDCSKYIEDFTLSPNGKRAIFGARGDIFTVPNKHGNTRNLTNTPGVNEKYATISPDGQWIAFVSDQDGEDDIYVVKPGGDGTPQRITTNGYCYKYQPIWSPDSKKLVWSNKNVEIRYVDINTKTLTLVDTGTRGDIRDYEWSPDSRYITYSKNNDQSISQVWVYSLADGQTRAVTPGEYDDYAPTFDPKGKYLYYLSNRSYNPILGNYEFNYILDKMTEVIAIVLDDDSPSPLAPQSDEIESAAEDNEDDDDNGRDDDKDTNKGAGTANVVIDFEGITEREVKLPIDAGQYGGLSATDGKLFFMSYPLGGLSGRVEDKEPQLLVYDIEEKKINTFLDDINGYKLTPDGKKMIVRKGRNYEIISATGEKGKLGENTLKLSDMQTRVDFADEWQQIYEEAWRLQRDFFYDSLMHGVDWQAMHDRYAPLVDHVGHRFDLTNVIGELIGELATSHTYCGGGDIPARKTNTTGLLGIDWAIDSAASKYRIGRILMGQNWIDGRRSPLTVPGIKAHAGDYVIAIDGTPLAIDTNPYILLADKANKQVTLTLSETASGANPWDVTVETISDEAELRYIDWVQRNHRYVDSISNGRVGYVHIPDMGGNGLKEFSREFFPQIRKEAMIIDVRYNGGGFVSQLIIERLRRVLGGMGISRNFDAPSTYPSAVFHGHLACLINEHSCSDGDIFPYHFREYGLGPLIGTRTWGGVVGIRGHRPLLDGGFVTTPEFAKYDFNSNWNSMENHGVAPDMEVQNLPEDVMRGYDAQMERAVEYLLEKIRTEPKRIPPPPSSPPEPR